MIKVRGLASANHRVKDLRPLRGALSRVLDPMVCSGWNPTMGACRSLFLSRNRYLFGEKPCSCLTEAIHFGNDQLPSVATLRLPDALRRNDCLLSVGIAVGIRRNTHAGVGTPASAKRRVSRKHVRELPTPQSIGSLGMHDGEDFPEMQQNLPAYPALVFPARRRTGRGRKSLRLDQKK